LDWENWLRTSAKRPSDHEDDKRDRTESQIRDALAAYKPLSGKKYRVYSKGSYANNTNVRLNYDVDIAVEYYNYFYTDLEFDLKGSSNADVGLVDSYDPYTREQFKKDIRDALHLAFTEPSATAGRIAYRVREKKTTLPADVVPCWEYRRYDRVDGRGNLIGHIGSRVYPTNGGHLDNFPKIQVEVGTAKNNRTRRRYKRMVRCLKHMQSRLIEAGQLEEGIPSYLVECAVFNVPDGTFGDESYLNDFRSILSYMWAETQSDGNWSEWVEVHGLKYLFRGNRSWTREQVHQLMDKAWDEVGVS
jgi:hypothetical protein